MDTSELRVESPLVAAFRHDVHKLCGRRHASACDEAYGVPVNESVPLGADADAALLSRPRGKPDETVDNHVSPFRLSLLTGETAVDTDRIEAATGGGFEDLVTPTDPEQLHATWLTSPVPAGFNESVYYPYSSLKYHVLLVGALLDNYRSEYSFDDLYLAVAPVDSAVECSVEAALTADVVGSVRTVLWTSEFALYVTGEPGGRPAAELGSRPTRSFADVWARLPVYPIDTGERCWRVLDAQLRRVRSWSTALQFIEDYVARLQGTARPSGGGGDAA
ncbi:hypothetical protein [Halobellus marinus]|uniref:hypothetical protein n=1 Tax=Halobellus TaxID=1073986 RepID=UPI0028A83446|nr:hypothetical protein [Halobellus sp. DFY28]